MFCERKNILGDLLQLGVHPPLKLSPQLILVEIAELSVFVFKPLSQGSFTGMDGGQSMQLISDLGNERKLKYKYLNGMLSKR